MVQLQEFDDFKAPRRRPWLLLIILVVVGGFFWFRFRKRPEVEGVVREQPVQEETAAEAGESVVDLDAAVSDMDVSALLSEARGKEQSGDLAAAREIYLQALRGIREARVRREVQERIGRIAVELVMTPRPMPEKVDYIVKRGDFVGKIARNFGTTVDLIQKSNEIPNSDLIKEGDRLRILQGTFRVLVSKKRNEMLVFLNDRFFKRYDVGTGKFGRTPTGTFKIAQRSAEPVWWRPDGKEVPFGDPENILGTRWMTLRATGDTEDVRGYGIHGTWEPSSIGKAESAGCIRMRNEEVEELYSLIPNGTAVEIVE